MPENPLLPNAQLRALHALLTQTVTLGKASRGSSRAAKSAAAPPPLPRREALLAGSLLQLCAGDILVAEPGDTLPAAVLDARAEATEARPSHLSLSQSSPQLTLAAGLAEALQRSGSDRVVVALLRSGLIEPEWAQTLTRIEQGKLPLIVACADPSGTATFRLDPQATSTKPLPLSWTSIQKPVSRSKLPVLSVDGEDAVAVYRVMQESLLRARSGGGPALIWAMLSSPAETPSQPKSATPLGRLERYLRTRQIAL